MRYSGRLIGGLVILAGALLACGGDKSTNPTAGLTFPTLSASENALYCVRGNTTTGQTKSGSITSSDCDADNFIPGETGYFEVWRVRVASTKTVTFTLTSPFDSVIEVYEIDIASGSVTDFFFEDEADNEIDGGPPEILTVTLDPDSDIAVIISGYDYPEVGSYSLKIE